MCWHSNYKPIINTAKQDIPVKKVLMHINGKFCSPIFSSIWEIGKELEESFFLTIKPEYNSYLNEYTVSCGFHSCSEVEITKENVFFGDRYMVVNKCKRVLLQHTFDMVVCDFIIPKGASYVVNEEGDYVSNRLKFIKISENYVLDESQSSCNENS